MKSKYLFRIRKIIPFCNRIIFRILNRYCDEIKVSVQNTEDYTITEGYYEVSTYDLWKEYNTDQNEILNTYLVYFKHQRGLKNSDSDGMLTIQIVEKTSDDMELNPLEQDGIYFDFM